jgi:hypothetical protein
VTLGLLVAIGMAVYSIGNRVHQLIHPPSLTSK